MFFRDATQKTSVTCKISTLFEDFSFPNPWSHLEDFIFLNRNKFKQGVQKLQTFAKQFFNACGY